jgi:hypothetical protein
MFVILLEFNILLYTVILEICVLLLGPGTYCTQIVENMYTHMHLKSKYATEFFYDSN